MAFAAMWGLYDWILVGKESLTDLLIGRSPEYRRGFPHIQQEQSFGVLAHAHELAPPPPVVAVDHVSQLPLRPPLAAHGVMSP